MLEPRIIKKYPNRRLYDTELSHYVTLEDVRGLVMEGVGFKVVDTSSNEDLTRSILLQIMLEEESGGKPLFTSDMLAQIIRFYGGTVQGMFSRYLEESLTLFAEQQDQLSKVWSVNSIESMAKMAQQNMGIWMKMQESFLKSAGFGELKSGKTEEGN